MCKLKGYTLFMCEAMLQESFNPPSQTHSSISPGDCMVQLLANSVSQISSIIAELQAKAKPSTDDLSEKNTEKSLEEKIEQFEYAKSTNTNTDNPIVIEQSEQLMASNNANSDEYTPLIEKNTLEKTLEINDNQEGISTLNGLIDDVSDNNIKISYAKAAKSNLDLSNPSKTPIKSAKDKNLQRINCRLLLMQKKISQILRD